MTTFDVTYDDLVLITAYMARHDYTPDQIAYAVEKPLKHLDVLAEAKAEVESGAR
jgi:hypothetical protein